MILVAQSDVEARLRRALTTGEITRLPGVADEASALVEGYLGVTYSLNPRPPEAVVIATSRVTARVFTTDPNALPAGGDSRSQGMGSFSATVHYVADSTSGGPWLTKSDKMMLAPYRVGVRSVPLVREGPTTGGS